MAKPASRRYTDAERKSISAEICERLAGGTPMAEICREPDKPSAWTVTEVWAVNDPNLAQAIARARDVGADEIAVDAMLIADGKKPLDGIEPEVARDKLRAEIRLKLLAKWHPKKYGEAAQIKLANHDGTADAPSSPLVAELKALLGASERATGGQND